MTRPPLWWIGSFCFKQKTGEVATRRNGDGEPTKVNRPDKYYQQIQICQQRRRGSRRYAGVGDCSASKIGSTDYTTLLSVTKGTDDGTSQRRHGQIFVWDGLHRGEAARQAGIWLWVEVQPGGKQKAEWLALTANQKHGLRRSRADLQRVVRLALLHPQGARLSDREIARHCGVDNKTVGRMRAELQATEEIPQSTRRTGADGRTIKTTNIGKRPISTLRTDFPAAILVSSQGENRNNGAVGMGDTSLNTGQLLPPLKMGGQSDPITVRSRPARVRTCW